MNKSAIKTFAVETRKKLIADISYQASLYGITAAGITPAQQLSEGVQCISLGKAGQKTITGAEIVQRGALTAAIEQKAKELPYKEAWQYIIEEVAYTWFNRLIALRFMEVNDYLPSHIRVLSSEKAGKKEPDCVTAPFDMRWQYTPAEEARIGQLKNDNKLDELFRMLFLKQCDELAGVLPYLFKMDSPETQLYSALLLNISYIDKDGVIRHLVDDIPEADWQDQVQIIGWLYQYYNTEPKEKVFANLKKNVKISKENIPAATQLFTPDWIVRYMVENSLGRIWVEGHPNDSLKAGWKYYLEEAAQEPQVQSQLAEIRKGYAALTPESLRCIDPCCGSGHILVYLFDVLMQIYLSCGYTERDAALSILQNNLYGLEIDRRAAQLAYFAVMMKARQYDRRIFTRNVEPHVYVVHESNGISNAAIQSFCAGRTDLKNALQPVLDSLENAQEYNSIINVPRVDFALLYARFDEISNDGLNFDREEIINTILPVVKDAEILASKYNVVVTNPPYMGSSGMNSRLADYVKKYYPDSKSDLFAVFIEKGNNMVVPNGINCMVTMQSWMFLSSFEKMRTNILQNKTITNLMHLENMVMGIAFGTAVTCFQNAAVRNYKGTYNQIKLCDIENDKPKTFPIQGNRFAQVSTDDFAKIPGSPVAYWASEAFINLFAAKKIQDFAQVQEGLKTGDNDRFIRKWYEVCWQKTHMSGNIVTKWVYHTKGGDFRKWYGNQEDILNYAQDGKELKAFKGASFAGKANYFKPCITYSRITSAKTSFRYTESGAIPNMAGLAIYPQKESVYYLLGWLNTNIVCKMLALTNPTINFPPGTIAKLPAGDVSEQEKKNVSEIVLECVALSKSDWNAFETSWDFIVHPLVMYRQTETAANVKIKDFFELWQQECDYRFEKLKSNEEELNRIFIDIYGLQDELTPEVEDKDVTVRRADLQREIRSLLSYAVGCMFGRYSLDVDGLAYAGGEWDASKYQRFIPDADNCLLISDEDYRIGDGKQDIVGRVADFVRTVYGADTLEANLDYIAAALGNKGNTSRDVIRNYFLKDFFADHCKIYQKRPIYWQFDSGKQNGFKALVYMHRWDADTIGNVRTEYLYPLQRVYESEIKRMQGIIEDAADSRQVSQAVKRKEKLQKQLKECKEYDEKLGHLALCRVDIDLDDGVKVNYQKVQTGKDGQKLEILAKM